MFRLKLDQLKAVQLELKATIIVLIHGRPTKRALIVSRRSHTTCVTMAISRTLTCIILDRVLRQTLTCVILHRVLPHWMTSVAVIPMGVLTVTTGSHMKTVAPSCAKLPTLLYVLGISESLQIAFLVPFSLYLPGFRFVRSLCRFDLCGNTIDWLIYIWSTTQSRAKSNPSEKHSRFAEKRAH